MVREKADVTVVSSKGQVVIPKEIRRRLGITPKTKMLVYGYRDAVILKKIEVPDVEKKLREMYRRIDRRIAKYGELTQEEIEEEIQKYRKAKRS
jgi:AbrB family looped-hinge helix DNA binding protein